MAGKGYLSIKMFLNDAEYRRKMTKNMNFTKSFVGSMTRMLGALGVATGIAGIGKAAIESAAKMETLETSFKALTGSAALASQTMRDLTEFTAKTPFQLEQVAGASRQLLAAGVSTRELQDELRVLGDLAAVTNVPLTDMAQIYSKAMNKGKLQAEELNQLSERGIPIMKELSDMYGVTKQEIFDMASKGKIGFEDLQRAMKNMTSEGGIANNAMKALSETSAGLYSTFKDNLNLTLAKLGDKILPTLNTGLKLMNVLLTPKTATDKAHEAINQLSQRADELSKKIREVQDAAAKKDLHGFILRLIDGSTLDMTKAWKDELAATESTLNKLRNSMLEASEATSRLSGKSWDFSQKIKVVKEETNKATESAEKFYTQWERNLHSLTGPTQAPTSIEAPELGLMDDNFEPAKIEEITGKVKDQDKAWRDMAVGIGFAGQAIGNFKALSDSATSADAKKRYQNAVYAANIGIPLAFLQGLTTSGGNYGLAATYAALAAVQAATIKSNPPSFAIGTTSFSGGPAILHPNETLTNLPQGTKVISKGMGGNNSDVSGNLTFKIAGDDFVVALERMQKNSNFRRT